MSDPPIIAVTVGDGVPERLSGLVELAASRVDALAATLGIPAAQATVVITPDLAAAVEDAWAHGGHLHTSFSGGRMGGEVAAKTIPMNAAGTEARVIFNAEITPLEDDDGTGYLGWLKLVTHELTHVVLTRLRRASGLTTDVRYDDLSRPAPAMASAITKAVEELRCELHANDMIAGTVKFDDDSTVPIPQLLRAGYLEQLIDAAENKIAHGWRAGIADARTRNDYLAALSFIGRQTDGALNLLGRAEAEARWLGAPSLLSIPELAAQPGLRDVIGPVWSAIVEVFDENPFPALPEFAAQERRIFETGYGAILQMWERLGLTVADLGDRSALGFTE